MTVRLESSGTTELKLPYRTLRDPSLPHQVVFFTNHNNFMIQISCNCRASTNGGHESMGYSSDLADARALYNNPANHSLPFGQEDYAKW